MNTENFEQQTLAVLLTQILQQNVSEKHISHKLILITTLATALMGVIYADNQVEESEKQHLKSIFDEFIPPQSKLSKLIKPIVTGILKNKIYLHKNSLSILSNGLKLSEKILILGLCYQMASADGEVAEQEESYIKEMSEIFDVDTNYLSFLTGNPEQKVETSEITIEIKNLLDPHHFQHLDPTFARAADLLRDKIISQHEKPKNVSHFKISYDQLSDFKRFRENLVNMIEEVSGLIAEGVEQDVVSSTRQNEAIQILDKAKSQNFRLAVVGEFSQGKSTLLNALVGEEIQPTRAIPCSGAVTVLRYGERQKVICRFNDNHEEEVPIKNYQELASISEEAALSSIVEELSTSSIHEIIFEHPNLELCRNHVEIVDSPGLNEHPNRTAITHQLLQNTDAVIFLANASRLLTEGERKLLLLLKEKLQSNHDLEEPVENLFVVVNFMDLLRNETNKTQVKQRANHFLYGSRPLIVEKDRLHFISAQAALDAILEGKNDEYLKSFNDFIEAIQVFLTQERGAIVIRQIKDKLHKLIEETRIDLQQSVNLLEGQIRLSESDQSQIIEQIGSASGWDVKLRYLYDELIDESSKHVGKSWEEWLNGIEDRISKKSAYWKSDWDDKENILKDFSNQFLDDLSSDFNNWIEEEVKKQILIPAINAFDEIAREALDSIYESLQSIDLISGSSLSQQFSLSLSNFGVDIQFDSSLDPNSIEEEDDWFGFLKTMGGGGLFVGGLAFLGVGFIPLMLASVTTGAVLGWLFGNDSEDIVIQMKQQVYDKGFEKFFESIDQISQKIGEGSAQAIRGRYENAINAIDYAISILNDILERQDYIHQQTLDSNNLKKDFIQLKMLELTHLTSKLDLLVSDNQKT